MNLGPQPTIDPDSPSAVEIHLLDEEIDLLGQELIIEPVQKLRQQKQFANLEELSQQIGLDAKLSLAILKNYGNIVDAFIEAVRRILMGAINTLSKMARRCRCMSLLVRTEEQE